MTKIFLAAYAEKPSVNKLSVVLRKTIENNGTYSVVKDTYLLPDKKSDFIKLTEKLYSQPIELHPTYQSKSEFQENFIQYTLDLDLTMTDANTVTQHYNNFFKLNSQEAIAAILDADVAAVSNEVHEFISQFTSQAENLYEEIKSDASPSVNTGASPGTIDAPPDVAAENPNRVIQTGVRPATSKSRPVKNSSGMSAAVAGNIGSLPSDIAGNLTGVGGDKLIEPVPELLTYPGDVAFENENNAGLVLGRDEFYRLRAHTGAGACYLYAGRDAGTEGTQTEAEDPNNPTRNISVSKPNDLLNDKAYLYLSQKSDPDQLLRVAGGTYAKVLRSEAQPRKGQSLAVLQADDVVIIGEESGIRLITGRRSVNAKGGEMVAKYGIDLIAGNDDSDLQPLVKGTNLTKYLTNLSKVVKDLRAILYNHITSQIDLQSAAMQHVHYDPFLILMGTLAYGDPLRILEGKNFPSSEYFEAGTKAILEFAQQQMNALALERNRNSNDDAAGLLGNPFGQYPILSEKNKTN